MAVNKYHKIIDWFDTPEVFNAANVTIPAKSSLPLQVVAATAGEVTHIHMSDGIGQFVGLYGGGAGVEELIAIISGGAPYTFARYIPTGTRLSIRNMENSTIVTGAFILQFAVEDNTA